jgi:hypothetical protein
MVDWAIAFTLIGLIGLNAWQHYYWNRISQDLINKLMSRNYQEFNNVQNSNRNVDKKARPLDLPEDLRTLQGFQF